MVILKLSYAQSINATCTTSKWAKLVMLCSQYMRFTDCTLRVRFRNDATQSYNCVFLTNAISAFILQKVADKICGQKKTKKLRNTCLTAMAF